MLAFSAASVLAMLLGGAATAVERPDQLRCHGQADPQAAPPQRIELYTSEGCSSCPPAERWLEGITAAPASAWLPLAFHVDYWDALGWPDRLADRRHTERQRQVARRARAAVYTPGVFVDGVEWRGWRTNSRPSWPSAPASGSDFAVAVNIDFAGGHLQWRVAASQPAHARWIALVQSGLRSEVAAGENAGRELRHGHVVRWLADASRASQGSSRLPADIDWRFTALVGWEEAADGATRAALRLPLAACGPD